MADFNVRSDAVNVEQIMEQIRARIREKRGVDYTEQEIRELASVKLEKFLDPRGVRSDLLEQYRRAQPPYAPPELPNFAFEDQTLFESTRGPLRLIRRLLLPILKLFFNPNPLIQALNIQSKLNASAAEREAKRDAARYAFDQLHYEVMHNLVVETTRLGIEVKNLKMKIESLSSRLEFNERRARALESVVVYKPSGEDRPSRQDARRDDARREDARRQDEPRRREEPRRQEPREAAAPAPPATPPPAPEGEASESTAAPADMSAAPQAEGPGTRSRRRRRRRGRRGSGSAAAAMGAADTASDTDGGPDDGADADVEVSSGVGEPVSTSAGDSGLDTPVSRSAPVADSRSARPEPFEHTFGAQAHPAEPTAGDPSLIQGAPPETAPRETPSAVVPPAESPSTTPEQ